MIDPMARTSGMRSANETAFYFAYGSNMSSARLSSRVASARAQGVVHLRGWCLAFDKPGRDGTGKANLVREPGALVWGVAYTLDPAEWEILDGFEPGYRRFPVRCERAGGGPLPAVTYRFERSERAARDEGRGRSERGRAAPPPGPSAEYLGHLVAGAQEHGLPADYRSRLEGLLDAIGPRA